MSRGFQGALLKTFGANDHILTVVGIEDITPHFRRFTFVCPTLFTEYDHKPTGWLRLWVPDLENPEKMVQRGYTIIKPDPEHGRFCIDFALHDPGGPASVWAKQAQIGDQRVATLYGASKFDLKETAVGYLLIGDAASLPAINSIIEVIPEHLPIELYIAIYHEEDKLIPITPHPRLQLHYVRASVQVDTDVAYAIAARDWSNWHVWLSTETKATKLIKEVLREQHGFPREEISGQPYWAKERGKKKKEAVSKEAPDQTAVPVPVAAAAATPASPPPQAKWHSQAGKRLLAPLKNHFIAAGAVQTIITLLEIIPFIFITELARQLLAGAPTAVLINLGVWALVLLGIGTTLSSILIVYMHFIDAKFILTLKQSLLVKLARLPLGWFTERDSGRIKHLVQDDATSLHYLVTHAVLDVIAAIVSPLAVLIYLLWVDVRITLILLLPIIVYFVIFAGMVQASTAQMPQVTKWGQRMNSEVGQFLVGMPVIRVFGGTAASAFHKTLDDYLQFFTNWQRPFTQKKVRAEIVAKPTTFLCLIVVVGTLFAAFGWLDPVDLLPFLLLGTTFGPKLLGIAYGASSLREGQAAANRLGNTLEETELEQIAADSPTSNQTGIEFRQVVFGYHPNQPIIKEVSFNLPPGTVTALVGPSGGGKSTLASLLARFYDIQSGQILINGRDIRSLPVDQLYQQLGFVFQDVQLLLGTVRDNIALAKPNATQAEIETAAKHAYIHDEILALANGYDTILGEESKLSGGQQQRLTIARVLLANPSILILDEATAFIDPEAEYLVQQALSYLMKGRTVLIIAHRLHTVVSADQLLVVDQGQIVQQGTHQQLVATSGLYQQLWEGM